MDGLTLYAVSSDGTMGVFSFDAEELEGIAPLAAQKDYLKKFGFEPAPLPTGFSHKQAPKEASTSQITPPPSPPDTKPEPQSQTQSQPFGAMNGNGVNKLVAKRNTKKRVQPKFVGSLTTAGPSTSQPSARAPTSNFIHGITSDSFDDPSASTSISAALPFRSASPSRSPSVQSQSHLSSAVSNTFGASDGFDDVEMMDAQSSMQVPISSLNGDNATTIKGKRKISDLLDDDRPSKARTLGGDRAREKVVIKQIAEGSRVVQRDFAGTSASAMLHSLPLLNFLSAKVEGTQDVLEIHNKEDKSE